MNRAADERTNEWTQLRQATGMYGIRVTNALCFIQSLCSMGLFVQLNLFTPLVPILPIQLAAVFFGINGMTFEQLFVL